MKIDKNIPIPRKLPKKYKKPVSFDFSKMKISDSVLIKDLGTQHVNMIVKRWRVNNNKTKWMFETRTTKQNNTRVWRVK